MKTTAEISIRANAVGLTRSRSASNRSNAMQYHKKQSGAVLVVGLVLLLVATILGVAALSSSITEERIAGNQRQIALAFMGAETGIARAVEWFETETGGTANHDNMDYWDEEGNIYENAIDSEFPLTSQPADPDDMVDWTLELVEHPINPKDFVILRSTGAVKRTPTTRTVEVLYARVGGGLEPPDPEAAYQCFNEYCSTSTGSNSNSAVYYDGRPWWPPSTEEGGEHYPCSGSSCDGVRDVDAAGVPGIFLPDVDDASAISTGNQGGDDRPDQIQGDPASTRLNEKPATDRDTWNSYADMLLETSLPRPHVIDASEVTEIPADTLGAPGEGNGTVLHIQGPDDSRAAYEEIRIAGNTHGAGIIVVDGNVDLSSAVGTSTFEGLIILREGAKLTGGKGTFNVFGSVISLDGQYLEEDAENVTLLTDADLSGNFTLKYSRLGDINLRGMGPGGPVFGVQSWAEVVNSN